jgi:hypothetical protein
MAGLSKAGKLYKEFLEALGKERPFYKTKDLLKEAEPIKKTMRQFKPEAYEKMTHFEARPSLDRQGKMGETAGPWVSLNPARSRNYGIDPKTFRHEMGHHLAYADPEHPLQKYLSNRRAFDRLPGKEQDRVLGQIEMDAWNFAYKAEARAKGGKLDKDYPMSKWLKSLALGTGGSMGILDLLQPNEAEAMPRGVYQAIGKGVMSKEVSSAAKVLVGKVLDNKTIKDVRKGQGNWRAILFDDDTMMTVTNTELTDLSRAYGTQKYIGKFGEEGASKTERAIKSLDYHYARIKPFVTKPTIEQYHHMHKKRLQEMGLDAPRQSLVLYKGRYFTMPSEYAEHLRDLGMLEVKKEIK